MSSDAPEELQDVAVSGNSVNNATSAAELSKEVKHGVIALDSVNYTIDVPAKDARRCPPWGKKTEERVLLRNVSVAIRPGKMMALMGPSGAGKSTLLDVIAGRKNAGRIDGDITFDGRPRTHQFKRMCGYVEQTDRLIPELTPREILYFTALLRLPADLGDQEKRTRVEDIIAQLGLEGCADTLIGQPGQRGISGGQAKRVNIGIELVTSPALLFLDEPTSGLDSATSLDVMHVVKDICASGVSITCTIHQPGADIFRMFESLLLLVAGEVVYLGPAAAAQGYFEKFGFRGPAHMNPAEFIVAVTGEGSHGLQLMGIEAPAGAEELPKQHFADAYRKSAISQDRMKSAKNAAAPAAAEDLDNFFAQGARFANSPTHNTLVLLRRIAVMRKRDRMFFVKRVIMTLITGLIFLSVYYDSPRDSDGIANRFAIMLLSGVLLSVGANSYIGPLVQERAFMYRERAAATYQMSAYYFSLFFSEFPFLVIKAIGWASILYWGVGFRSSASAFLYFMLNIVFIADVGYCMAQFFAFALPTFELANGLMSVFPLFFMVFSGFFLPPTDIPNGWIWMYYLSYMNYAMASMATNEFADNPDDYPNWQQILYSRLGIAPGDFQFNKWNNLLCLCIIWFVFKLMGYVALRKCRHQAR